MKNNRNAETFIEYVPADVMGVEKVKIGDLYINLDAANKTTKVTYQTFSKNNYSSLTTVDIPANEPIKTKFTA